MVKTAAVIIGNGLVDGQAEDRRMIDFFKKLMGQALAWVLRDGIVASVLAGASRPEQVLDNIKAAENTAFTDDELALIEKIAAEK